MKNIKIFLATLAIIASFLSSKIFGATIPVIEEECISQGSIKKHKLHCGYYALYFAECWAREHKELALNRGIFKTKLSTWERTVMEAANRSNNLSIEEIEVIKSTHIDQEITPKIIVIPSISYITQLLAAAIEIPQEIEHAIEQCRTTTEPVAIVLNIGNDADVFDGSRDTSKYTMHWITLGIQKSEGSYSCHLFDSLSYTHFSHEGYLQDLITLFTVIDVANLKIRFNINGLVNTATHLLKQADITTPEHIDYLQTTLNAIADAILTESIKEVMKARIKTHKKREDLLIICEELLKYPECLAKYNKRGPTNQFDHDFLQKEALLRCQQNFIELQKIDSTITHSQFMEMLGQTKTTIENQIKRKIKTNKHHYSRKKYTKKSKGKRKIGSNDTQGTKRTTFMNVIKSVVTKLSHIPAQTAQLLITLNLKNQKLLTGK